MPTSKIRFVPEQVWLQVREVELNPGPLSAPTDVSNAIAIVSYTAFAQVVFQFVPLYWAWSMKVFPAVVEEGNAVPNTT